MPSSLPQLLPPEDASLRPPPHTHPKHNPYLNLGLISETPACFAFYPVTYYR